MSLEEAITSSKRKRDAYLIDCHVLKNNNGEYYSVLDFNLHLFLRTQIDQGIYYTSWNYNIIINLDNLKNK